MRTEQHTDWCARNHSCGMAEHRSTPHSVRVPGVGSIVIVRVQDAHGRQHAELRINVPLDRTERTARHQLRQAMDAGFRLLHNVRQIGSRAA